MVQPVDHGSRFHPSTPARERGERKVSNIAALQEAVLALPEEDYARFREWFRELDWDRWDQQIDADSVKGKLDFLIALAQVAKGKGALQEF